MSSSSKSNNTPFSPYLSGIVSLVKSTEFERLVLELNNDIDLNQHFRWKQVVGSSRALLQPHLEGF